MLGDVPLISRRVAVWRRSVLVCPSPKAILTASSTRSSIPTPTCARDRRSPWRASCHHEDRDSRLSVSSELSENGPCQLGRAGASSTRKVIQVRRALSVAVLVAVAILTPSALGSSTALADGYTYVSGATCYSSTGGSNAGGWCRTGRSTQVRFRVWVACPGPDRASSWATVRPRSSASRTTPNCFVGRASNSWVEVRR